MNVKNFVAIEDVVGLPHIIVDCESIAGTVIALSHWPDSHCPAPLMADTSTQIVFNYLDQTAYHTDCTVVTNNHFDKDGLAGIYTLLHPDRAQQNRQLLIDLAHAGDFRCFTSEAAVKIAFTSNSFESAHRSPFPSRNYYANEDDWDAEMYKQVLDITPNLLEDPNRYAQYWQNEYRYYEHSKAQLEKGAITIREHPALDLAIVYFHDNFTVCKNHELQEYRDYIIHEMAINSVTTMSRILYLHEQHVEFRYRYESWVDYITRTPQPRLPLDGLLQILNKNEKSGGKWYFPGTSHPYPRLLLLGSQSSTIPIANIENYFMHHLSQ